ncbi:MAG TPA: DUF2585 family protein [Pontiellaceae bacterium]|nr:DUF2585 family protein [Pontiellaceae bacterium]
MVNRFLRYKDRLLTGAAFAALLSVAVLQLHNQGRIWWCACARPFLWDGDIRSAHTSQHLADPYSFTHILHGVIFYGLIRLVFPRLRLIWRLWCAVLVECLWEILENSSFVIQRYRETTIGLGYTGDSIANSLSDITCCALGFFIARRIGFWRSAVLFAATELVLLFWIRDNLTLNVLMLLYPVEAIKSWQMVH